MAEKSSPEQKIIDRALKNLKRAVDAVQHNYSAGVDDLRFANGDQWDSTEKARRSRSVEGLRCDSGGEGQVL